MLPLSGEVRRKGNHVGKKPQFRAFQILITACTCWMLFFFFFFYLFGCAGSSLLCGLFSSGGYSSCSARTSHFSGSSCCRARGLGHKGFSSRSFSRLSICSSWVLERRLRSCGTWALLPCSMWDLSGLGI